MKNKSILLCLIVLLVNCTRNDDLTGNGSQTGNALTGQVVDNDGAPAKYVKVNAIETWSGNFEVVGSDISDERGMYEIHNLEYGWYNILMMKGNTSAIIDSVKYYDLLDTVPLGKLDTNGTIAGVILMAELDSVNQSRMNIYIRGTTFSVRPNFGGAFTINNVPPGLYDLVFNPEIYPYLLKVVKVRVTSDSTTNIDTLIFYGNSITGIPVVNAGVNQVVETNSKIHLAGTASDSLGKSINYYWDVGDSGKFVECLDGSLKISAPRYAIDSFPCVLKVVDNDNNTVYDTVFFTVAAGIPYVKISPQDELVAPGSTFNVIASVIDPFGVWLKYEWAQGDSGTFIITESCTLSTTAPTLPVDSYPIKLRVTDDAGHVVYDSTTVRVFLP